MSGPAGCSKLLKLPPSKTLLNDVVGISVGFEIEEFEGFDQSTFTVHNFK